MKKPFVPPDPLISMVKSALARAGVSIGGVAPPPPVKEEPIRVAEMLAPRAVPVPREIPSVAAVASVPEFPSIESEPLHEDLPELPAPVKIDAGSQPLAFGSMLESPVTEEEGIEEATTARPQLERDWNSGDKDDEVEEEEEEGQSSSWRRDAGDSMGEEEAATGAVKDWRETAFAEAPGRKSRNESWAPQKEISRFEEASETEQSVGAMVTDAPVSESSLVAEPAAAFTEDAWAAALSPKATVEAATMEAPVLLNEEVPKIADAQVETQAVIQDAPAITPAAVEPTPDPKSPRQRTRGFLLWQVLGTRKRRKQAGLHLPGMLLQRVRPLANTIPETVAPFVHEEVAKEDPAATVDALAPAVSEEVQAKVEEAALPPATVEAIREEAHQVAETAVQEAPAVETTSKASDPSMEDMVAKVLAKMSPEMLQAVTRDILKNVVESMVRDELNAKKQ